MSGPRYFVLTGGQTPHEAIDYVEARGHRVIATSLTPSCSMPLYGVAEIEPPDEDDAE